MVHYLSLKNAVNTNDNADRLSYVRITEGQGFSAPEVTK